MTVIETASGMMLGETEDSILTILRGSSPTEVNFRFITSVGPQMRGARDDAVRYVHVQYPNWTAGGAELTTSERDVAVEGPSMGAALATLLLSAIEGFAIDRHTAVRGDISADGQILPIGGVYAKLHGAEAADCTVAVIPRDNLSGLINTKDFIGKGEVPAVQVLGAETIEDVIADVRSDRDEKLSQAIELFGQVQAKIGESKAYVHSPECAEQLTKILNLAPKHLSAKLLLMEATHKRPKTLSVTATKYYVTVAVSAMLPAIAERAASKDKLPPSSVVQQGLADLEKLRPIAAPETLQWIDAMQRLVRTIVSYQSGLARPDNIASMAQQADDEEAKINMNPEIMQKMLKEGI
jgi:hypothetical protein